MAYKRNIEIFEEAYEKKDAKSVVSYVARDGRKRYIAGSKSPDGGGTPMPSGGGMTEVTWQELKDKRDNGELNPGSLYRITDYQCTTTQENTKSAGHQFDIVLLALSEDKLAEEGWAMMHDGVTEFDDYEVYTVIFSDNTSKQCYLKKSVDMLYGGDAIDIIECDKFVGMKQAILSILDYDYGIEGIDESTHTAKLLMSLSEFEENATQFPYNYFQNSNLSAWKVWYCLDNDKSRFAWADEENGKGVIYRLIDEWNNDVGYDFKNIQLYLPIVDGEYVSDGEKTWVYTFCLYNSDEGIYEDGSLKRIEVSVDDIYAIFSNNIMVPNLQVNRYFSIPFNLLLGYYSIEDEDAYSPTECNFFNCNYAIVQHASNVYLYNCTMRGYVVEVRGIYYNTKKVLTES